MKAITQLILNMLHKVDALLNVKGIRKITLIFSLFISLAGVISAQDSNHIIAADQFNVDASKLNILPGDTVYLQASTKRMLIISNFHGTPENYIVFVNYGGEVIIQNDDMQYGICINNSSYFRLSGTGSKDITYGIKVMKTMAGGSMGLTIGNKSTNYEIDHLEIANVGFAGIMAKTDPKSDMTTNRDNFTQYESILHDNYIHNTGGEGMYIGHSFYNGIVSTNSAGQEVVLYPSVLKGVHIYNNRIDSTGWDGLQVGCATEDCEIYANKITNYGLSSESSQQSGLQINAGTTGKFFNNYISNGTGNGMTIFGLGNIDVYNNIILNSGYNNFPTELKNVHGIFVDDRGTISGSSFNFYNNTIVNPKADGIRFYSVLSKNNKFQNNIILNPGSINSYSKYSKQTPFVNIGAKTGIDAIISNNFFDINSTKIQFEDEKNYNFKLLSTSPALEAGLDLSNYGVDHDFDNNDRPIGRSYDLGAYQRKSNVKTKLDSKSVLNYNIYPNPSNGKFHISRDETSNINISIRDILGKVVKTSKNNTDKSLDIDITDLAANGKYFVTVNDEYASITKTIIIQ